MTAAVQADVFAGIDPLLPAPTPAQRAGGVELSASLPDGRTVGGSVYRAVNGPDAVLSLWRPRVVWEFTPLIGDTGPAGMDAALGALRGWLEREVPAAEAAGDCELQVMWPSRDVSASRALHAHGLVPTTALAVRPPGETTDQRRADVLVRTATMADVDELVGIIGEEARYSAEVLAATPRENAAELLSASLKRSVYFEGRTYVAEADGVAAGAAVCGVLDPGRSPQLAQWLPGGWWGYIGQFAVLPALRGSGIGGVLVAETLQRLEQDAQRGTFLFYELANPLSSVFWPRRGYRPLWTRWVCRPASLLR
jgi:GNAT superfamily N-acetyltransferase